MSFRRVPWVCLQCVIVACPGPEVIKRFQFSTQLSIKFIMHINVKLPTIVDILILISMINIKSESLIARKILYFSAF